MSEIIKICHIDNEKIKETYNFVGNNLEFRSETESKVGTIINNYIHKDDSIKRIKNKIIMNCNLNVSMSELYLFTITKPNINVEKIYNDLTQNEKNSLTNDLLCNYYLNIVDNNIFDKTDCSELEKDVYSFDDLLNLDKINSKNEMMHTLGHKVILKRNYEFVTNPFYFVKDKNIESIINFTTLQNNKLLFEFGDLKDNTIYLCTAEEVLSIGKDLGVSEDYLLKLYFPELYITHKVKSLEDLLKNRDSLIRNDVEYNNTNNIELYNDSIDLLYNLYYKSLVEKKQLDYVLSGINKIQLTIHPLTKITLPLELLFKFVHSSNDIPLIKYNPGKGQENVYRLFTSERESENGKKIPKLYEEHKFKKTKILKLISQIDNRKKVTYTIREIIDGEEIYIFCGFLENGDIELQIDLKDKYKSVEYINTLIKEKLNSLILVNINKVLEQSGYSYNLYENIHDEFIEINNVEYHMKIKNNKKINLKKIIKCITNVFKLDTTNIETAKDEILMNYKRVSNFDVMDSINAYITTQKMKNILLSNIIEGLMENYKLTKSAAEEKYNTWMTNINFEVATFENKKIKILSNPGFRITIKNRKELTKEQIFISLSDIVIENITDLKYIEFISIFIDSLFRLLFNMEKRDEKEVNRLCKGKKQDDIIEKKEIQAVDIVEGFGDEVFEDLIGMEESSSDEEDEEEEEEVVKKTKNIISKKKVDKEEMEVDFSDIHISGSKNYFLNRLRKKEPNLFLIKAKKGFKMYSRSCPWQHKQYPVILTQDEKDYIDGRDKELKINSYDEHITYGTTKKKYHYICPRFWCFSDENGKQRSLSFEQINKGECGGWDSLIRKKSGKVPKGKRIFEFTDVKKHKEGVNTDNLLVYRPMYPGFQHGNDTHPDGLCVPCCNMGARTYKDQDKNVWEKIEEKTKNENGKMVNKILYKNTKTGEKTEKKPGESLKYKYMFKGNPLPKNAEIGPDGKIDLSKITNQSGKRQKRPLPKPKQIKGYNKCNQKMEKEGNQKEEERNEEENETKNEKENETKNEKKKGKINNAPLLDAFPLRINKIGYLPLILQRFIGYDSRKRCQKTFTDSRLKDNTWCLLRVGIEKNKNQSFLEIMRYYYNEINKVNLSLLEFKNEIFKRLNDKIFIKLQNGNLYKIFKKKSDEGIEDVYQIFKKYIYDKEEEINYEYLWDFICLPEKDGGLFKDGCNLIILREPENDLLQKIELICPTNLYSGQSFDISKPTLIMYTLNGYYEPLIRYKVKGNGIEEKIIFDINNLKKDAPELVKVINIIVEKTIHGCKTLKSKPFEYNEKYDFQSNITSYEIIKLLKKLGIVVETQVLNNNMKVVGLNVKIETDGKTYKLYLPTYPSAINVKLGVIEIKDPNSQLGTEFYVTLGLLKKIHESSNKKILCEPKIKIVNDKMIVGIITQTNQFIPVIPTPYQEASPGWKDDEEPDGLKVIENNTEYYKDYFNNENMMMEKKTENKKRKIVIKKIKLESNFYNVFRNTLRIVLNNNNVYRLDLLKLIEDNRIYYSVKIKSLSEKLFKIMQDHIEFTTFGDMDYEELESVEKCFGILDETPCRSKKCCTFSETKSGGKNCKLFIPEINLINGRNNREYYFLKISDEIIRYKKMRLFLFDKSTFFSFTEIHYKLNDREIILLEDLLLNEYFVDIKPYKKSKFINTKRLFDLSEPLNGKKYKDDFELEYEDKTKKIVGKEIKGKSFKLEEIEHISDNECVLKKPKLKLGNWVNKGMDENDFKILELKSTINCVLGGLKMIIEDFTKENISKVDIKKSLITTYERLLASENGRDTLLKIWDNDNKIKIKTRFNNGEKLESIIINETYKITISDLISITTFYSIPLILFSPKKLTCFEKRYNSIIIGGKINQKFYLLLIGGNSCNKSQSRQKQPDFGIIQYKGNIEINVNDIGSKLFEELTKDDWSTTKSRATIKDFDEYRKYNPKNPKKFKKIKPSSKK